MLLPEIGKKKLSVIIFNSGEYDSLYCNINYGDKSVGSPANMKNGMAIGASESGPGGYTDNIGHVAYFSAQGKQ